MLYLTYRPTTIQELDTAQVRTQITAVLSADTIPHALLLTGQKGMGKTSVARIIAKAVNCLQNKFAGIGASIEPCNSCNNCESIDTNSNTDVIEQDAASNRGIDDIKELTKEAGLMPMQGRYRVFIIDECHMITTEGFNALLKTLEEPPKSALFILATTNKEKVPKTIISRCVTVNFAKATESDIVGMLSKIAKKEKLDLGADLLQTIAESSDSSYRDATKLLEQVSMQGLKTRDDMLKLVGISNSISLITILSTKPLKDALQYIEDFGNNEGSIKELITKTLYELHSLLLVKNGIGKDTGAIDMTTKQIAILIKLLHSAFEQLRYAPIENLPLQVAIAEYYQSKS
jgi:DNA polymerase III subunit gamma/tau